ncbi:MAG: hypothetical protein JWM38_717 [Sphingomonas bacterium]|nr:hypothetical protein [Sphingomonas bacterium]
MANVTYPCYQERKDSSGFWYWIYYASNGKAIARSSESYVRRDDGTHSIQLVQGSASHPIFFFD